jgi:undecaprenyl-diphosphatase
VLGAVQGLTEFLPISSSGHLVLVPEVFGWDQPGLAFDVMLHIASLLALVVYFRADLWTLITGVIRGDGKQRRLAGLLVIATIPAAAAGVLLGDYFEEAFEDATAAAVQLLFTAAILVAGEQALRWHRARTGNKDTSDPEAGLRPIDDLNVVDAGVIGVAQAISILPGISRSGSTIAAGLGLGFARSDAARFSFFLAVPALFGAALVKVPDLGSSAAGTAAMVGGFLASLITSYLAIGGLIRYLKTSTLYPFAAYCVIAGLAFLALV